MQIPTQSSQKPGLDSFVGVAVGITALFVVFALLVS